jgi:hypothetical protein
VILISGVVVGDVPQPKLFIGPDLIEVLQKVSEKAGCVTGNALY